MADLVRTGLSLERELLDKFDHTIARRGYRNRSEAIRDLIREHLVSEEDTQTR
jgi:CopG family transcriptional regulator, nickel-responsive regulator